MLEKLIEAIVRIAVALEVIAAKAENHTRKLGGMDMARPKTPVTQEPVTEAATNEAMHTGTPVFEKTTVYPAAQEQFIKQNQDAGTIPETLIPAGPQDAGVIQQPTEQGKPPADGVWDPTTAEIQGSYRTKDKKDALEAALLRLGITAPSSWTFAKKHRAILDHVAQFGAVQQMSWADFETKIKELVAAGKRDAVLAAVQTVENHQVVAQTNIQPANYQKILDLSAAEITPLISEQEATGAETAGQVITKDPVPLPAAQPTDYQPGVTVVNTPDTLASYARYLMAQGITPQQVQGAVQHIAQGVTYVPAERVPEAFQALQTATGK